MQYGRTAWVFLLCMVLSLPLNLLDAAPLPDSLAFVAIPSGTYTVGTNNSGPGTDDAPSHQVTLSNCWMSETETTNAQYVAFLNDAMQQGWIHVERVTFNSPCGAANDLAVIGTDTSPYADQVFIQLSEVGGCTSNGEPESDLNRSWIAYDEATNSFSAFDLGDGVDRTQWPVTWIKWYGAAAFALFYGVDLPTEAQWEVAARSGDDAAMYATSTGLLDQMLANYNGDLPNVHNPDGHVVAARSYAPNPWGLYEMSGNVWEWCRDYYTADYYAQADGATDPWNADPTDKRVKRGASWNFHSATLTVYARGGDLPDRGNNHFGFRVVSETEPNTPNTSIPPAVDSQTTWTMELQSGLNLIHVPLDDPRIETIADVYQIIGEGAQLLVVFDTTRGIFLSYSEPFNSPSDPANIPVQPYTGMIAVMSAPSTVTFEGEPYANTDVPLFRGKEGINLMGLPVNDPRVNTTSDLLALDGSIVAVVGMDDQGRFQSYPVVDLNVSGGQALLVITSTDTALELSGKPWTQNGSKAAPSIRH